MSRIIGNACVVGVGERIELKVEFGVFTCLAVRREGGFSRGV